MVSIKISRGKFSRRGLGTSGLRMLLRLTAVKAFHHIVEGLARQAVTCSVVKRAKHNGGVESVLFQRLAISLLDKMVGVLFPCFYDIV